MSLIAVAHGLIVCDSCRYTEGGYAFKTGKVFPYAKPVRMRSKRFPVVNDFYFGFSGTGEDQVIEYAGNVAKAGQLDLLVDRYKHADDMRLITEHTHFTLVFFGLKGLAYLSAYPGDVTLEYAHYGSGAGHAAFGSGAKAFTKIMEAHDDVICPVTAAYLTTMMEPSVGGAMEVWALPTEVRGKENGLRKLGVHPNLSLRQVIKKGSRPAIRPYLKESQKWLLSYIPRLPKDLARKLRPGIEQKLQQELASPTPSSTAPSPAPSSPASSKSPRSRKPRARKPST